MGSPTVNLTVPRRGFIDIGSSTYASAEEPSAYYGALQVSDRSSRIEPIYHNLTPENREIRLLSIVPGVKDHSQPVHCRLQIYSLDDINSDYLEFMHDFTAPTTQNWTSSRLSPQLANLAPLKRMHSTRPSPSLYRFNWGDFAALSYVWGDQKNKQTIVLNGHEISVTANLEAALRMFQSGCEFNDKFKLWVDALCINQDDLEERSAQIKMMRDIYGSAWSVISWLGEESSSSSAAIQLVRDLAEIKASGSIVEFATQLDTDPSFYGGTHWIGLQDLMDRPYWFRLWIIQEVIVGSAATWIRCGQHTIAWETFCDGISVLQEYLWLVKDRCLQMAVHDTGLYTQHIWRTSSLHLVYQDLAVLSKQFAQKGSNFNFERLLDLANSGDCTDKRDKVYALVGLMAPAVATGLNPDYTLPEWKVYREAARAFIRFDDNLDALREGNPWGPARGLTWAADWSWPGRIRWTRHDQQIWGPAYLFSRDAGCRHNSAYHASGDRKHNASFDDGGLLLRCTGVIIDAISGLSARGTGYFSRCEKSIVFPENWKSVYGDRNATAEALYRALICDRVAYGHRSGPQHSAIFHLPSTFALGGPQFKERGWKFLAGQEGYYFRWEQFRTGMRDFPLGEYRFDDFFSEEIPADASEFVYTEAYSCFDRSCKKRRFMTTDKGYLGWAPDNIYGGPNEQTQKGDLVAIVFGCSTPLVIRPCGEDYLVLGEAYVQGLMDGEVIAALESGKYTTQSFAFW
ncbi:heterokaryon incompatibility protein-domain-containing protein [Bipolaris maydis]|nr:heterokaryon incompatibility protein-domain-containing protein [Bipolaris maydis]KAJ6275117.1 heterokaryon incompatibility protein-domain-containing protein [Bipolaris maydis]KAJ6285596.1 heterokaryon incompatibility protein-domain-containing protein [Bipolaris maydis]